MFKADGVAVGLRVDVDTLRGTKLGVPRLLDLLARHGVRASFFFSVGPDNMGRHLWRLLRPTFLRKMIRSQAGSLYGWQILLMGTLWPGPMIGDRAEAEIKATAAAGHEVGLHAWDHHRWQTKIDTLTQAEIETETSRGLARLTAITGQTVTCAAAPAWRLSAAGLKARADSSLRYASDCRGDSIFMPLVPGFAGGPPQIPATLPTFDEVIGQGGITRENYNAFLLRQLRPGELNVLTIHAEVEGLSCQPLFAEFLEEAGRQGARFLALGDLLPDSAEIPSAPLLRREIPGREGWLSWQGSVVTP